MKGESIFDEGFIMNEYFILNEGTQLNIRYGGVAEPHTELAGRHYRAIVTIRAQHAPGGKRQRNEAQPEGLMDELNEQDVIAGVEEAIEQGDVYARVQSFEEFLAWLDAEGYESYEQWLDSTHVEYETLAHKWFIVLGGRVFVGSETELPHVG